MSVRIDIPKPCPENWEAMAERGNGRYCGVCEHVVPDLTRASDAELNALLQRNAWPACARLRKGQLQRTLKPARDPARNLQLLVLSASIAMAPTARARPDHNGHVDKPVKRRKHRHQKIPSIAELTWNVRAWCFPDTHSYVLGRCPIPQRPLQLPLLEVPLTHIGPTRTGEAVLQSDRDRPSHPHKPLPPQAPARPALLAVLFDHQRWGRMWRRVTSLFTGRRQTLDM